MLKFKILMGLIGLVTTISVILLTQSQFGLEPYADKTTIIDNEGNFVYLTIATIDSDAAKYVAQIQPTADYLAERLSSSDLKYKGKVVVVRTNDEMIELLRNQKIDIALDSPIPIVYAADKTNGTPFLIRWKNGLPNYHSIFVVKNESSINSLEDIKGKTIIFEKTTSSSAYYLPKYHLLQHGLSLGKGENNVNFVFSGDDKNTVAWLLDERGDVAALSNVDYDKLEDVIKQKIRIIERTQDIPRFMVIHRAELEPKLVEKISEILVSMGDDPLGSKIMNEFQDTTKYVKIEDEKILNQIRAIHETLTEEFQ